MRRSVIPCFALVALTAGVVSVRAAIVHDIAESGQVGELKRLIDKGTSIDTRDERGMTPLMHAVVAGNLAAVKYLVEAKADQSLVDSLDRDALDCALYAGKHDAARVLVSGKVDLNRMYANGQTRLTMAAIRGDIATVHFLLMAGADREKRSRDSLNVVESAQKSGCAELVDLLKNYKPPAPIALQPAKGLSAADSVKLYAVKEYANAGDVLAAVQAGRRSFAGCVMKELDLARMNFAFLDLRGATFDGSDLRSALFLGAKLDKATFKAAYLRKASFQRASVVGTSFSEAYLTSADLRAVTGLELEQLRYARNLFGIKIESDMKEMAAKFCKPMQLQDPGNDWVNNPWFVASKAKGKPEQEAPVGDSAPSTP